MTGRVRDLSAMPRNPILASMARSAEEALVRPFRRWQHGPQVRACDHPGCREEGLHRAPRSRERLREYFYFCLEHVRAYNRAWDYFAGMDEDEIEAERRRDACWQRPSWPLGSIGHDDRGGYRYRDDFGIFENGFEARRRDGNGRHRRGGDGHGTGEAHRDGRGYGWRRGPRPETPAEKALAELDLVGPVTFEAVKARYKELAKRLHPDANGGDRSTEDRLKIVNQAYATLRAAYAR